ncbi:MAG: chaperone modulator CbpM [Anaerolineae bacterium]
MTGQKNRETQISLHIAVRETGLSHRVLRECTARQMVREPLSDQDLVRLRRVRRLRELGINMQGIEVILHMRQRIEKLQAELERWERQVDWSRGEAQRAMHLLAWERDPE